MISHAISTFGRPVYLSALGSFLPGDPIPNDAIEDYLGLVGGRPSRQRERVLERNGILTRHYALDQSGRRLHTNYEMAAKAVNAALHRAGLEPRSVEYLAAATTLSDVLVPGFASLVHGASGIPACDIASFGGVCASGTAALKSAWCQVASGAATTAISCASEFASRHLRASVLEASGLLDAKGRLPFDADFLRWMLSDGAGAALLSDKPSERGLCYRIEWIDVRSHADSRETCMYAGAGKKDGESIQQVWADHKDYTQAATAGMFTLRQDMSLLPAIVPLGVAHYFRLLEAGRISTVPDHFVCHYSAEHFRDKIVEELARFGAEIPAERWFSTLTEIGNTGSASIYIMLERLLNSGRLQPGHRVLAMVPESGRFITSFISLTVVDANDVPPPPAISTARPTHSDSIFATTDDTTNLQNSLMRQLTTVWIDFAETIRSVPVVRRIENGTVTLNDYQQLLLNLRQQVMEGSRWITRAASNITSEYVELRAMFIKHAADEQRDFLLLENNYTAVGGDLNEMRKQRKNIGSEAFSAWMFQAAERENPFHLAGAMFVIEGIGSKLAASWASSLRDSLQLKEEHVSFMLYHGKHDEDHLGELQDALAMMPLTADLVEEIVRAAKMTARLYRLQLEELGNF